MQVSSAGLSRDSVTSVIRTAARDTGADFGFLLRQAEVESGLNPNAKAPTSSATGLFQFIDETWMTMVRRYGADHGLQEQARRIESGAVGPAERAEILSLRRDPGLATRMAAEFAAENARALKAAGTPEVGPTELYLAHFLGAKGAVRFMQGLRDDPQAPAAAALPRAAEANPSIFMPSGRTASFRDVYDRFAARFEGVGKPSTEVAAVAESVMRRRVQLPDIAAGDADPIPARPPRFANGPATAEIAPRIPTAPAPSISPEAAARAVGARPAEAPAPDSNAPITADTVAKFLTVVSDGSAPAMTAGPERIDASGRDASEGARI
jgi:hypothetical protein